MSPLKKKSKNVEDYITELEEKVVDLSLQLKSKSNELISVRGAYNKNVGKLIHNLKNPIGVIFSFSEMMLEDMRNYSLEKLEKYLQVIKNSANFSIELLNKMAKLSQVQSLNFSLNLENLNYLELTENALSEFQSLALEKKGTLERNFSETPLFLHIDAIEISYVIKSVLNNAFRYSTVNPKISISVIETKNMIETIIKDEGIGISKENLPFIFNDFFVVNTYSEDKQKCIGLGLAISSKIIKQHHGEITVISEINKGSSFKISIPKI